MQSEYGGTIEIATPGPGLIESARDALASVTAMISPDVSYARVDGVVSGGRFLIMELELIEPFLFFEENAAASNRFAEVIAAALLDNGS